MSARGVGARTLKPRARRLEVNHEFSSLQEFVREYIDNVSSTGAFVRTKKPLPVGSVVNLRFSILADEVETLEGVGRVVRVQKTPSGMGVRFTHLTSASRSLLVKILARP